MRITLIENENFSLIYDDIAHHPIFHYFVYRKNDIETAQDVIDPSGLICKCTIFSKNCSHYFNKEENEQVISKIKDLKLIGYTVYQQ